jgi:hypothetical protein
MVKTKSGLDITTLKVGDTLYEYNRLIDSYLINEIFYKKYKSCTVSVIVKEPMRKGDGCWEWEANKISTGELIYYCVCENLGSYGPYVFNHKKWDAEDWR